jgi:heme o synthase
MKTEVLILPGSHPDSRSRTRGADLVMLAKPRLNLLVVLTTTAGYYMAAGSLSQVAVLLHTIMGTALVAAGASALNQLFERQVDARMSRTRLRPLPDGRMQPGEAAWVAVLLSSAGLLQLAFGANPLAAGLALATLLVYAFVYTPLKRQTPLATVVGAVPGALPPLIGWAAARHSLTAEAWVLFGIVFLWQMPHFLAIAWMYRQDYEQAGLPLLPVIEPDGRSTGRQSVLYAAALLPVSLAPVLLGLAGGLYFTGAMLLGIGFLTFALTFACRRHVADARRLFLASLIYLPLLWALMIADRMP